MAIVEFGGKTKIEAEKRLQSIPFLDKWKFSGVYPQKIKWGKERGYAIYWTNNQRQARNYRLGRVKWLSGHKKLSKVV